VTPLAVFIMKEMCCMQQNDCYVKDFRCDNLIPWVISRPRLSLDQDCLLTVDPEHLVV